MTNWSFQPNCALKRIGSMLPVVNNNQHMLTGIILTCERNSVNLPWCLLTQNIDVNINYCLLLTHNLAQLQNSKIFKW